MNDKFLRSYFEKPELMKRIEHLKEKLRELPLCDVEDLEFKWFIWIPPIVDKYHQDADFRETWVNLVLTY